MVAPCRAVYAQTWTVGDFVQECPRRVGGSLVSQKFLAAKRTQQSWIVMKTHVLRRKTFGALIFFSWGPQLFIPGSPTISLPMLAFAMVSR